MAARNHVKVTLADGATASSIANGNNQTPAGIYVPRALTGTTIKFNAYDSTGLIVGRVGDGAGSDYTVTVASAADQYVRLDKNLFSGVDQVQLVSGSAQSGATALTIVFE